MDSEIPLEYVHVEVAVQTPHRPSALRLAELQAGAMSGDRQEFEAIAGFSEVITNATAQRDSPLAARL